MSLWTNGAEPADVEVLEKELQAVVSSQGRVAVLMIVEATSPIATVGAQSKAVAMVRALGGALRTVCIGPYLEAPTTPDIVRATLRELRVS